MIWAATSAALLLLSSVAQPQSIGENNGEALRSRIQQLEQDPGSDEQALKKLQDALAALERAKQLRETAEAFEAETATVPTRIEALEAQLQDAPLPVPSEESGLELSELQARQEAAEAQRGVAQEQERDLELRNTKRDTRKTELPDLLATSQAEVAELEESWSTVPEAEQESPRSRLLEAQLLERRAQLAALRAEQANLEAAELLFALQRERAARQVQEAEQWTVYWTREAARERQLQGEKAAQEAETQVAAISERFPILSDLAAKVQRVADLRAGKSGLPERIADAQERLTQAGDFRDELKRRAKSTHERIQAGGLTEGTGRILRRDFAWLPRPRELTELGRAMRARWSQSQLETIDLEEQAELAGTLPVELETALAELRTKSGEADLQPELVAGAQELVESLRKRRKTVIDELHTLTNLELQELREHENKTRPEVAAYRSEIEKHILWIRSSSANPLPRLLRLPADTLSFLGACTQLRPWPGLLVGSNVFLLLLSASTLILRPRLRRKREELSQRVRSFRTDRYLYTVRTLIQTLLLAAPGPLLAFTLGRAFAAAGGEWALSAGRALQEVATIWLALRFGSEIAQEKGLGLAHFRWSPASVSGLRSQLRWFTPFALPLAWVTWTTYRGPEPAHWESLGRLCFAAIMVGLALLLHRLLALRSEAKAGSASGGFLEGSLRTWLRFLSVLPIALAVLALTGFDYTAMQFEYRLLESIGFGLSLVLINALLLRWLFISRRRLAVRQALEAKARREEEAEGGDAVAMTLDADKVDIPAVDAKTRQLFQASLTLAGVLGIYAIWASTLPALQGLERVQLWPTVTVLSSDSSPFDIADRATQEGQEDLTAEPEAKSLASTTTTSFPLPAPSTEVSTAAGLPAQLTLADVLLALLFLVLTTVAAKNLPALIELAILQRLPLDGGARYAISTIVRYLLLIIGISAVSGAIGVGWQQVQWLAAALTFGLAFGLQEIFANFVSGLIILIERPVRVGDIVTVGQTEGRVTQLRMRATTITDWDRRELLVPNKEFITGSVVNWTLSDPVTRIVVRVGVAYGSDVGLARRLLRQVAEEHPLVLDEPAPHAIFRAFGDSTLDFELRAFLANRDLFPKLLDELHQGIERAFREAEIEIAFPQRDLHIRTAEAWPPGPSPTDPNPGGEKT